MNVYYDFLFAKNKCELHDAIFSINRDEDKIIAVTQGGELYTIFYERNGNRKEEPT